MLVGLRLDGEGLCERSVCLLVVPVRALEDCSTPSHILTGRVLVVLDR